MSRCRLLGISLMVVSVFKLAMTPIFGVRPDPVNLTITLIALALGGLLVFWFSRPRRETAPHRQDQGVRRHDVDKTPSAAERNGL